MPFGVTASSDNHDPTRVIANVYAAGLGLPDRDYYLKDEPRFKEAREKYLVHVAHLLELGGASRAEARKGADAVFALEKQLAQASLDNVQLRDPKATDHKTTFVALTNLTPMFDWPAYFAAAKLPRAALNVQQPGFMKALERVLGETPLADWKAYLRWHLLHSAAPSLSTPFVAGGLRLLREVPRRRGGDEAALEALRGVDGRAAGRGAREEVRREVLPAGGQGADAGAGQEPAAGHGRHDPRPRVDEPGDEGEGAREARDLQPEDRLPGQVEGLLAGAGRARRVLAGRRRRPPLQRRRRPRRRSASPSTAAAGA